MGESTSRARSSPGLLQFRSSPSGWFGRPTAAANLKKAVAKKAADGAAQVPTRAALLAP
jgi:hypothetical protein